MSRLCSELCGVSVSVGSVPKLCEQISAAVAAPVEALAAAVRTQRAVGMDETGWRVKHRRRYLWVVCSAIGSIFKIGSRAAKVGQGLLGADFAGGVMTDRYVGHDWIRPQQRQLCWAHLDRDAQALIDLGIKAAADYRQGIHKAAAAIFKIWREFQEAGSGPEARQAMQAALVPVQERLRPLLLRGCRIRTRKVVNLCSAMESAWESLWVFSIREGVAPTNNGSERAVRKGVQWRKKSLGTHSDKGAAFVDRMLAVTATCRQQGRSPLHYLTAAAEALRSGTAAPSLLPPAPPEGGPGGGAPQPPAMTDGLAAEGPRATGSGSEAIPVTAAVLAAGGAGPHPGLDQPAPLGAGCAPGAPDATESTLVPAPHMGSAQGQEGPAATTAEVHPRPSGDSAPAADCPVPRGPAPTTRSQTPGATGTAAAAAPTVGSPRRSRGPANPAGRGALPIAFGHPLVPRNASP